MVEPLVASVGYYLGHFFIIGDLPLVFILYDLFSTFLSAYDNY